MFHAKSRRAESLIETMIAITVIVIATTAALNLVKTALAGNQVIGEKLVAMNLGLEAVEAVRNMRDTNYLLFADDPGNCWDVIDIEPGTDCSAGVEIEDGAYYVLERDFSSTLFDWNLAKTPSPDLHGKVSLYEIPLSSTTSMELYAQNGLTSFDVVEADVYRRILSFDRHDSYPSDWFDVTVTVYWDDNGTERSLTLTRSIINLL